MQDCSLTIVDGNNNYIYMIVENMKTLGIAQNLSYIYMYIYIHIYIYIYIYIYILPFQLTYIRAHIAYVIDNDKIIAAFFRISYCLLDLIR